MHPNLLTDPRQVFADHMPRRVVSLVPSTTASLYDLGFGEAVVGISDFCPLKTQGAQGIAQPVKVGGTKNPDIAAIAALQPDLVIANREENSQKRIEALAEAGLLVWLTFPLTVQQAMADLRVTAQLFHSQPALQAVSALEKSLEWAQAAAEQQEPVRVFCPIWEDQASEGAAWWMSFNAGTYPSSVLAVVGFENVFAHRERRYPLKADLGMAQTEDPGERDTRYPRVRLEEIIQAQPEVILLPDEPYVYTSEHGEAAAQVFAGTPAARSGRIHVIDGKLLMWHGTYLARALDELPPFLIHTS